MNKTFPPFRAAFGSGAERAALVALVGCSSAPTRESTGEYVDDSVITGRVKAAIFNDPC